MDIRLIDTGFFHADGGAMFGAIPKTAWSRRYPSNEQNGCILAMRSMLIHNGEGKIILIDNGAGNKHLKRLSYYNFFGLIDLKDELLKQGITCEEVTDVILTHLHFDHCGYTTQQEKLPDGNTLYKMSFPNATHWVSRRQWENFLHPNALEADSYFIENMQTVCENSKLCLIENDTTLCPGINLRLFDGHTPGQIVPYVTTPERTYVFAGDVIPLAASVSPAWISAYDTCPLVSYNEKLRMLEEAAAENQAIIYCHDAYTASSTVKKVNDFFKTDQKFVSLSDYNHNKTF